MQFHHFYGSNKIQHPTQLDINVLESGYECQMFLEIPEGGSPLNLEAYNSKLNNCGEFHTNKS